MLRTLLVIGAFTLLGLFALKLAFGVFGFAFSLLLPLVMLAVKIAVVGAVIYLGIRLVSPETARKLRSRWGD